MQENESNTAGASVQRSGPKAPRVPTNTSFPSTRDADTAPAQPAPSSSLISVADPHNKLLPDLPDGYGAPYGIPPSTPPSERKSPRDTPDDDSPPSISKSPTAPTLVEPPKRSLVRRANTFFTKLTRTTSNLQPSEHPSPSTNGQPQFDASKPISATNRRPPMPGSRSARNTPNGSTSHSPPSPGSLDSSASEAADDQGLRKVATTVGYNTLKPPNGQAKKSTARGGVKWNTPDYRTRTPTQRETRRRSLSTDNIQKVIRKPNEVPDPEAPETKPLHISFSQHANEGTGLKARRLSTSLPDQFHVDFCELNNEYKSTKMFASRGKKLGVGATAEVTIMAVKGSKDELVAVKEFRGKEKGEDEADYIKKVKSEYTIAKSLHHPNIVETLRLCTHAGRWNHVMEYCEMGDVYRLVDKGLFKTHYKVEDRLCFFKQVLRAIDYLHSHGIAHRDIKLENLLMTSDGFIKLTDFGVSEVFSGEHPGLRASAGECGKNMGDIRRCAPGMCGSLPYMAPEVLAKDGDYDPRPLDVWSSAIMYITMQFGGPPWLSAKPDQPQYARFTEGWDKWLGDHPDGEIKNEENGWPKCGTLFAHIDPPPLRRLLLKMLNPNPGRRIAVREILTNSFLKKTECCCPDSCEDEKTSGIDALKGKKGSSRGDILPKHSHLPPKDHRTPKVFQHRFDMGDGWS